MNPRSESEPTLKERQRQEAREEILAAAEALFGEQGLDGARMDAIARRAGVSVGTLYNHFGDRDGLLQALLEVRRAELLERLDAAQAQAKGAAFAARLEAFVRAGLEQMEAHRPFYAAYLEGGVHKASSPGKRPLLREVHARAERLVRGGVEEGTLRKDDAARFPGFLVDLLRGTFVQLSLTREPEDIPSRVRALVRLFLHGAEVRA